MPGGAHTVPGVVSEKLARWSGPAALIVSLLALVVSLGGIATAVEHTPLATAAKTKAKKKAKAKAAPAPSTKPRALGLLLLDRKKHFPASVLPLVARAKSADNAKKLGAKPPSFYLAQCSADAIDLGSWCIDASPYPLQASDVGKNDYFFATQACAAQGGFLPDAGMLIGVADRAKLNGTLDDNQTTAGVDIDPTDGLKDKYEMSSTLVTTAAGSDAAGSQGVTAGSTGNPNTGEPNPVPMPADPSPETLQYVTVYDNHNHGGFAGSRPVGQPAPFRCAYAKQQGQQGEAIG